MEKIVYTRHAENKLNTKESKKFVITKSKIKKAIRKPVFQEYLPTNFIRIVDQLDKTHSLCVIIKSENGMLKVITFFPAEKGRYESKILS